MTEQEKYIAGQKASGIDVGDTVRVVRKAESYSNGWATCWCEGMDSYIGEERNVCVIDGDYGIKLRNEGGYAFPYFVLEIVKKADGTVPVTDNTNLGESSMSVQEQTIWDVTVIERKEKLHSGSGVVQEINRTVLFDDKVPAVTQESAKQKALAVCNEGAGTEGRQPLDFDKLEITCKPF